MALVQRLQVGDQGNQLSAMSRRVDELTDSTQDQSNSIEEKRSSLADLWNQMGRKPPSEAKLEGVEPSASSQLDQADQEAIDTEIVRLDFSTTLVRYDSDWSTYLRNVEDYARTNDIDLDRDPFQHLLSDRQRSDILKRIETDFDKKSDCDRWDYALAASCGVLAGLVDAFLVGAPGKSLLGGLSDNAADQLVEKFSSALGWKGPRGNADSTRSAIGFLERKFQINYDHRHGGDVGGLFEMSASNHHIKSLAHSPSPVGLLFSVLDQFTGHASFVADGQLIRVRSDFALEGSNVPSKLFAAFVNWIGHILSDFAGASGSKGRGSGVPMPFFELLQFANVGSLGDDKRTLAEMAVKMFEDGYDARFGAALAVPVLINELFIRIAWMVKRRYYHGHNWRDCKPSANQPSLRRMLLVGYGSLVLVDVADAAVRKGFQPAAMLIHLNFVAWMRFAFLGLREAYRLVNADSQRMRRIDDAIDTEMTSLLAESAFTRS